MTSLKFNYL